MIAFSSLFINVTQKTSVYMNIVLIMKLQNKGTCMLMYFPNLPGTCLYWKKPNVRELKGHRDVRTILKLKLINMYVFQEGKKLRAI